MKKLLLVVGALFFASNSNCTSAVDVVTDPRVVTATIGFAANVLPEHIVTNDSGLIFAACVNYLMAEGFSFDRAAKFAVAYIAGAVLGRVVKASMKPHNKQQPVSEKISAEADAWAAQ